MFFRYVMDRLANWISIKVGVQFGRFFLLNNCKTNSSVIFWQYN